MVIKYSLYNVGDAAAVDITMTDNGFGVDDFDVAGGQSTIRLDRLAPGANNSHTLVVRPKKFGYFNFTSAEIRYRASEEDGADIKLGFSSTPGQGMIIPLRDYERQFSAHTVSRFGSNIFDKYSFSNLQLDWIAFAVMTLPSLGIPFILWFSSKSKYERIARSKKD